MHAHIIVDGRLERILRERSVPKIEELTRGIVR
jgi:hypothetical protein